LVVRLVSSKELSAASTGAALPFMSGDLTASERLLLKQFEVLDEIKVSLRRAASL
jgi:hypothetical protein